MRPLLRLTAALWLTCQFAVVCAPPAALAWMPVPTSSHEHEACCPGLKPGQICPMHHTREGTKRCLMQNACGNADAALVALVFTAGVMPSTAGARATLNSFDATRVVAPVAIARFEPPDPPPPRA